MRLILFLLACHHGPELDGRRYYSHVPAHLDGPAPLLVLLHPYGRIDGEEAAHRYDLVRIADEKGLILAAPDGTVGKNGLRYWNATDACCSGGVAWPDDVSYIAKVVGEMKQRYRVDRSSATPTAAT